MLNRVAPQALDYSALSAQAVARVEQARKAAQQQIASVLEAKPKLAMRLFLEAPKIAVPVPSSDGSPGEQETATAVCLNSRRSFCSQFHATIAAVR